MDNTDFGSGSRVLPLRRVASELAKGREWKDSKDRVKENLSCFELSCGTPEACQPLCW